MRRLLYTASAEMLVVTACGPTAAALVGAGVLEQVADRSGPHRPDHRGILDTRRYELHVP